MSALNCQTSLLNFLYSGKIDRWPEGAEKPVCVLLLRVQRVVRVDRVHVDTQQGYPLHQVALGRQGKYYTN